MLVTTYIHMVVEQNIDFGFPEYISQINDFLYLVQHALNQILHLFYRQQKFETRVFGTCSVTKISPIFKSRLFRDRR